MSTGELGKKVTPATPPAGLADPDHSIQLALLAAIVASSDDAIVSKTLEGRILSWNEGATRIFGYQPVEVIGESITIIIPPELHDEERQILDKVRRGERVDHFDTVRVTKDGRRLPISLTVSPVRDSRGVIIGASKVARDISERKHAELLLATQAAALARLSELSLRLWRSGTLAEGLEEMLAAAMKLLGAEKGQLQLLDPTTGVLTIRCQHGFAQPFLDSLREVTAADETACGRSLRDGERVIIEDIEADPRSEPLRPLARAAGYRAVISNPLVGADGTRLGMVSVYFRSVHRPAEQELRHLDLYLRHAGDFVQRCRVEEALRESEEALRNADRRKDEFLALLAHELRNPLAPIRYALAASNKSGRTSGQQKHAEEVIERQVAHMSRLLDDLMDVSRITRGTLELKKCPTELTSVVGAAIETARPAIDLKRHTLTVELPTQPMRLEADTVRLAQVLSNLLINAARYTEPGGHIQLRAIQKDAEILISVRDDGIGIDADMMPRLFTMFARAPAALGHAEGGLGVGLSLVRGLIALHGGSVEARSEGIGRGSEFLVWLPVGEVGRDAPHCETRLPDRRSCAGGLRILVVDDNRDAADTCATLLQVCGHDVRTAYTGRRALEVGDAFHPDALLLDIGLPDLDGYELAQRVRAAPWGRGAALIAVTGWGQEEDRRRAFEAGFDHHLTKPIATEAMESLLRSLPAAR